MPPVTHGDMHGDKHGDTERVARARGGRPKRADRTVVITVVLSLRAGDDSDLIAMFRHVKRRGERQKMVKAALRGRAQASSVPVEPVEPQQSDDDAGVLAGMLM